MKNALIILISILFPILCWGQNYSDRDKPFWANGYSSDHDNSVINVVSATGYSKDDARNKAIQLITANQSLATGQRSNVNVDKNGTIIVTGQDNLTVKARIRDEYSEQSGPGEYRYYLLVQTAKNPTYSLEPVNITNSYKFSPRVFIPGMAQIHKGQTLKGALFITGEIAAVAGIIAFEGMRSSYESKIKLTHNATDIKNYIKKADDMKNIRNGFICGAVAIYAWNVIDGIVCKGKSHIEVGNADMSFVPYTDIQSAGVMMAINF